MWYRVMMHWQRDPCLQVFEGLRGERATARDLTPEQKKRRVVLKRVNMDGTDVRRDFLAGGTMAKGAAETGKAEAYMNARIMRDPVVRRRRAALPRFDASWLGAVLPVAVLRMRH